MSQYSKEEWEKIQATNKAISTLLFVHQFNAAIDRVYPLWKLRARNIVRYCASRPLLPHHFHAVISQEKLKNSSKTS